MSPRLGGAMTSPPLEDLPPRDPRGWRLRRWLPGLAVLGLIAAGGWVLSYLAEEEVRPSTQKEVKIVDPGPSSSNGGPPKVFADLLKASRQDEAPKPPQTITVPVLDPALQEEVARLKAELQALQ